MGRPKGSKNKFLHGREPKEVRNERTKLYAREHIMFVNGKRVHVDKRHRPEACEVCGYPKPRLNYHHWDDDHPEKGLWLCGICHYMAGMIERDLHNKYLRLKQDVDGSI